MTDDARLLALLWRDGPEDPGPRRGPRQRVSLDGVLDAGVALADAEGLDALSMRALARRLGLGAMSLYTYVPGRDELVVLMVDRVLAAGVHPSLPDDVAGRLRAVAEAAYAEYAAHPWLLATEGLRAWLGPGATARYEWQLGAVEPLGLGDVETDRTVTLLDGLAAAAVRARHVVLAAERRTGRSELEWWEANAEPLGEAMAGRSFPLAERVGRAAGEAFGAATDPDGQFRFALDVTVAGLLPR
ncbi:TetR/AcrR family transcriptional regulator [Nocardioides sp. CFH 31398]|uniref:TetR/AcrR family transcriptional regulator n=1 Tax=Nocardioides sp. CFH 31398 TaxID=2919579 RepID=UPI001F06E978|nr:helix-turn-helix domain-containing protein [Nocardioides sp. CFH 31398]MCH1865427.1 TetR/AcrR family transcriptional regulator [Nocardioides sp. CFH 31398]